MCTIEELSKKFTEEKTIELHEILWDKIVNKIYESFGIYEAKITSLKEMVEEGYITEEEFIYIRTYENGCFLCLRSKIEHRNKNKAHNCEFCFRKRLYKEQEQYCLNGYYEYTRNTHSDAVRIKYAKKIRDIFKGDNNCDKYNKFGEVNEIITKAEETNEEFIFETIIPYCEDILQIEINKKQLKTYLLLGIEEAKKRGLYGRI